jgi:hypothetical protein
MLKHTTRLILVSVAGTLILVSSLWLRATGQRSSTSLGVSARVLGVVQVRESSIPKVLVVTPRDVQRGYVRSEAPAELRLLVSDRSGAILRFSLSGLAAKRVLVTGLATPIEVTDGKSTTVRIPYAARDEQILRLRFSVFLDTSTGAGEYPFPLLVEARPTLPLY